MCRRPGARGNARPICAVMAALVVASCMPARTSLPDAQAEVGMGYSFAAGTAGADWPSTPWWQAFDDPLLQDLLLSGLRRSAALSAAQARIAQARSNAEVEGVLFNPDVGGSVTATRAPGGGTVSETSTISVSFPIDVTRRQRREQERALIEVADALAARDALVLALSGEIAQRFVRLAATDERLRHAREDLRRRQALVALVEAQIDAGDATQFELLRARAAALDVQATRRRLEGERVAEAQELAGLLGGDPQLTARLSASRGALGLRQDRAPSAVPADLVRARPDIRRLELQYDAARTRITDAEADRLPRISISGTIDASGAGLGWRFGPSITLPALSARVRDAAVEREISAAQAILFDWQDAVVTAVSEVEAAHARLGAARAQVVALRSADQEYNAALTLAEDLFAEGEITLLDRLDLEQSRAGTRRDLADARAAYLDAYITLHLALGVDEGLAALLTRPL